MRGVRCDNLGEVFGEHSKGETASGRCSIFYYKYSYLPVIVYVLEWCSGLYTVRADCVHEHVRLLHRTPPPPSPHKKGLCFHGEAGLSTWEVDAADKEAGTLTMSAYLRRTQLKITRTFTLVGPVVKVDEVLTNLAASAPKQPRCRFAVLCLLFWVVSLSLSLSLSHNTQYKLRTDVLSLSLSLSSSLQQRTINHPAQTLDRPLNVYWDEPSTAQSGRSS